TPYSVTPRRDDPSSSGWSIARCSACARSSSGWSSGRCGSRRITRPSADSSTGRSAASRQCSSARPTRGSTSRPSVSPPGRARGGSTPGSRRATRSGWRSSGPRRRDTASSTPPSICTVGSASTSTTRSIATTSGRRPSSSRSAPRPGSSPRWAKRSPAGSPVIVARGSSDLTRRVMEVDHLFLALGHETFESDGARFVRDREFPGIHDANHVADVTVDTPEAVERLLARADREFAHCNHRLFLLDARTPPAVEAGLLLRGYERSDFLFLVLEGTLTGVARGHDVRALEDEAGAAAG